MKYKLINILLVTKLGRTEVNIILEHYLFKVNNRNTRKRWKGCLKLTIKTLLRLGIFIFKFDHIVNFEHSVGHTFLSLHF